MNNLEFLKALFDDEYINAHVTDFTFDPTAIPGPQIPLAWLGDRFENYKFEPASNQFFTISVFKADASGRARRRKDLFRQTHVIVLDDVGTKIPRDQIENLPLPTWSMETSPGNFQFGYKLDKPETDRHRVENLLDGLVSSGLCPDGKDPGMKGVTRYVRLPGGVNNKAKYGLPFAMVMKHFDPSITYKIDELADWFDIDINAKRHEDIRTATDLPDHPIFVTPLKIKSVLSAGRFDIECPWIDQHTDRADSGTAVFTNDDGTLGFKCHHGHCEDRKSPDLIRWLDERSPGFSGRYADYVTNVMFQHIIKMQNIADLSTPDPIAELLTKIVRADDRRAKQSLSVEYMKLVNTRPFAEQIDYHNDLADVMGWSKTQLSAIVKEFKKARALSASTEAATVEDVYANKFYVREQAVFYDMAKRIFYKPLAFQDAFSDIDPECKKNALQGGMIPKVDRLDFAPGEPDIFEVDGTIYGNTWNGGNLYHGEPGDVSVWLNHFETLGWLEYRHHILQWMAFTIRFPEKKINHVLLFGGGEGIGKDFLLEPLMRAMGPYKKIISGNDLLSSHNDYMLRAKYLHINETELGDHKKSNEVAMKLKPLAAAPPDTILVNPKHVQTIDIRNIVNVSMTTNSRTPLKISDGPSRRLMLMWSDFNPRDVRGEITPEWKTFFSDAWQWMRAGGWKNCIYYLRNHVDLTSFDPGKAPPVTEFLMELTEANKHPATMTLEVLMREKIGAFAYPIISVQDVIDTIRLNALRYQHHMYIEANFWTPPKVGRYLAEIPTVKGMRARNREKNMKLYVIAHHFNYEKLSGSDLYKAYWESIQQFRMSLGMGV